MNLVPYLHPERDWMLKQFHLIQFLWLLSWQAFVWEMYIMQIFARRFLQFVSGITSTYTFHFNI